MVREGKGSLLEGAVEEVGQPKILQWRQEVAQGPLFLCNRFGVPIPPAGTILPQWIKERQHRLRSLPSAKRNKILTGDPGFPFDPVAYATLHGTATVPQHPPEVGAEAEDHVQQLPEEVEVRTPPRAPSPVQQLQPTPPFQQIIKGIQKVATPPGLTRTGKTFRTPPPPGAPIWRPTPTTTRSGSPSQSSSRSGSSLSLGARAKQLVDILKTPTPAPGTRPTTSTSSRGRERFPKLKAKEEAERKEAERRLRLQQQQQRAAQQYNLPPPEMTAEEKAEMERRQSLPSTKMARTP